MNNLEVKINECKSNNSFKRVDDKHALDLYIGINQFGYKTFAYVTKENVSKLKSTKIIETSINQREDNKYILTFTLKDSTFQDLFFKFCEDIIESTRYLKDSNVNFIIDRWNAWINMFKNFRSILLSENEIRGLLGELIFLNEYMFDKYGINKSINSWIGVNKAHKDFEISNTWYEVKCIKQNALTAKISSIEQLDSEQEGTLVLVRLEESNEVIEKAINLNSYIEIIKNKIDSKEVKELFNNKLIEAGYLYDDEYENYNYAQKSLSYYNVTNKFPKLSKDDLKEGIVRVSYEIYLNNITEFEVN